MKLFLAALALLFLVLGIVGMLISSTTPQEVAAALLAGAGLVALAGAACVEQLQRSAHALEHIARRMDSVDDHLAAPRADDEATDPSTADRAPRVRAR